MLNRRTIRIKIMQSVFAYQQCKEADLLLAHDYLEEQFSPNLNSVEVQDKEHLRQQKKSALQFFDQKIKNPSASLNDSIIEKKVNEAISLYQQAIKKDQTFLGKNILIESEKLTSLYHSIIALLVALADQAAQDKKGDHNNFVTHPCIHSWQENEDLKKAIEKERAGWETRTDKVRAWFRDVVKDDEGYRTFMAEKNPTEEQQKEFIKHVSRKLILGKTIINDYFDEQNIRWTEDKDIVKSMVDKTIKSYANGKTVLQKLSLNWEEDKEFINTLFNATIELAPQHKDLIAKNTRNWEVDRLALTDRVIIEMALAEMIHFPNIPVKVTINEYIELTKEYSTPKSRTFINGILDVISKSMKESGVLKKSGKGLLDNK